ncbi:hypothetical protein ACFYRN_42090 [Streptomyces sp. NPDC005227]|uniref:hypothetical protein n=1 Tax=Streptomyces sp. NPDC005227 TaxID=3364707 RepID=UPI00369C294A
MAKSRKGYYRAGHHVGASSPTSRWKTPSMTALVVVFVLAIAGWNTLFGGDSDSSKDTPRPEPSGSSASAAPGQ